MTIKVDTETLLLFAKTLRNAITQLDAISRHLRHVLLRLDNVGWEISSRIFVENQWGIAERKANLLSQQLHILASMLERKAELFEQVESENAASISNLASTHANLFKTIGSISLLSTIPYSRISQAHSLGNLIGPKVNTAQSSLPMALNPKASSSSIPKTFSSFGNVAISQIPSFFSAYSKIRTIASTMQWTEPFYHSLQLGNVINSLSGGKYPDIGYKIAGFAVPLHQALIKKTIGSIPINPFIDFAASGDYSVRGLGKAIIGMADNALPVSNIAKATNIIFQSAVGPALIIGSTEVSKFFSVDPYYKQRLSESQQNAFKALKKVDITNLFNDTHSLAFDSLAFLSTNIPLTAFNPQLHDQSMKQIQNDISSLQNHVNDFGCGTVELWDHFYNVGYVLGDASYNFGYNIGYKTRTTLQDIAQQLKLTFN